MQIAICDDVQKDLETIRLALDTYAEAHPELHFTIDEYGAAIDVLHAVEKGKIYDIALLDICMPGVLGTDAAEEMLAKSPDMSIVFLSTSIEYAVTAFAINATHYLLKPFSQEQFNTALDRAVKKTEEQNFL
ncbi:MAG: response regulator, partial [Lachnospiraceae bacterium]|nr:response regulator [Lachnospiraceae bacterium]